MKAQPTCQQSCGARENLLLVRAVQLAEALHARLGGECVLKAVKGDSCARRQLRGEVAPLPAHRGHVEQVQQRRAQRLARNQVRLDQLDALVRQVRPNLLLLHRRLGLR